MSDIEVTTIKKDGTSEQLDINKMHPEIQLRMKLSFQINDLFNDLLVHYVNVKYMDEVERDHYDASLIEFRDKIINCFIKSQDAESGMRLPSPAPTEGPYFVRSEFTGETKFQDLKEARKYAKYNSMNEEATEIYTKAPSDSRYDDQKIVLIEIWISDKRFVPEGELMA